jgi:Tfp pilus assembly protein PilW
MLMRAPATILHDEQGFTLVEMLVSIVTGMVVILATLSVLDISISQSSRISERVDADQHARLAMEKIMLELHSSCISTAFTPVQVGSTDTKLIIVSQTGSEAYFTGVTKHVISLSEGKLTDASYPSTNSKEELGATWKFAGTPSGTQTLARGISKTNSEAIFKYYKYVSGNLSSTALTVPLSETEAKATAEVTVSFTTAPTSERTAADRTVQLSNTAVLRYDPATASGSNEPCK